MAKCLRCGAGNEWIQGEVKKELATEALAYKGQDWQNFVDEFNVRQDRILRDMGMSSKEVLDANNEVFEQLKSFAYKAGEDLEPEKLLFDFCQSYCNSIYNINLCVEKQRVAFIEQFLKK